MQAVPRVVASSALETYSRFQATSPMLEGLILLLRQTALDPERLENARHRLRDRVCTLNAAISPASLLHSMTVRRILAEYGDGGAPAAPSTFTAPSPPLPLEIWTREIGSWLYPEVKMHDPALAHAVREHFEWLRCLAGLSRNYRQSIEEDAGECLTLLERISFLHTPLQSLKQATSNRSALSSLKCVMDRLPEWLKATGEDLSAADLEIFRSLPNSLLGSLTRRRCFDALSAPEFVTPLDPDHPLWSDPALAFEHLVRNPAHLLFRPTLQLTTERAIDLVSQNHLASHFLPTGQPFDVAFVIHAIALEPRNLVFHSEEVRNHPEVRRSYLKALKDDPMALALSPLNFFLDRSEAECLIEANPCALAHLHAFQADERLVEQAIRLEPATFRFADLSLQQDRAFVLRMMHQRPEVFAELPIDLKRDPEILDLARAHPQYDLNRMAEGVENSVFIEFAERFSEDETVLRQGLRSSGRLLRWARALQSDRSAVLESLRTHGRALRHAPQFQEDPQVALLAIQQDPTAIEFAGPALRSDPAFAFAATSIGGYTAACYFSAEIHALEGFAELSQKTLESLRTEPF